MTDIQKVDTLTQLVHAFRAVEPRSDADRKLDLLLDLDCLDCPRVLSFLLDVLRDDAEPERVRIEVLSRLRDAPLEGRDHRRVGRALGRLAQVETMHKQLRLQAAQALGKFTDVEGIMAALRGVLTDAAAPIELRYNAFTSLYVRGPTVDSIELLRELGNDESLGPCAVGLLRVWGAMLPPACRDFQPSRSGTEDEPG
jgi:hypothetical protein